MSVGRLPSRCSALSLAAREPLHATAAHALEWLVVEVAGSWPRDVGGGQGLPDGARDAVLAWRDAAGVGPRRVLFVRRPGHAVAAPLVLRVLATEELQEVRRIALGSLSDLAGLELGNAGELVETSLVLVCGHGSRDRCCAASGTAVYRVLSGSLGAEQAWISSHQGGHRFAPNLLVLPSGIQLGRVAPELAPAIAAKALAGEIDLDHYRGRTCYPPEAQAAEQAVREATGLTRLRDLSLVSADGGGAWFRSADGTLYGAVVERVPGPEVPPSCGEPAARQTLLRARLVP